MGFGSWEDRYDRWEQWYIEPDDEGKKNPYIDEDEGEDRYDELYNKSED